MEDFGEKTSLWQLRRISVEETLKLRVELPQTRKDEISKTLNKSMASFMYGPDNWNHKKVETIKNSNDSHRDNIPETSIKMKTI